MASVKAADIRGVPGATFVEEASTEAVGRKKRKHKGGKKHKKPTKEPESAFSQDVPREEDDTEEQPHAETDAEVEAIAEAVAEFEAKDDEQVKESTSTEGSVNGWTEVKTKTPKDGSEGYHKNKTTSSEWRKDYGGIPIVLDDSVKPLTNGNHTENPNTSKFLNGKASSNYTKLSDTVRIKVDEFLNKRKTASQDADWTASVRQMIWRAVVRANYWWVNPDTEMHTGKPKPVEVPDGVYLNNFEVFVMCCAKRADRVGRDLPDPEYVQKVESEVRQLLKKAEKDNMQEQLNYLAFLLMFDEEEEYAWKRTLTLDDMQARIGKAFAGVKVDWSGNDVFKASTQQQRAEADSNFATAESFWQDAAAQS